MKRLNAVLFILCFATFTFAQSNYVLNEQFSNNNNEWSTTSSDTYTTSLSGGEYHINRTAEKNSSYFKIPVFIDIAEDFDIEMKFKQNSGILNNGFGLVFGYNDIDNFYTFVISGDGSYKLAYYEKDEYTKIKSWTSFRKADKMGKYQTLRFKQEGSKWKFYSDGEKIYETEKRLFFGSKLGFVVHDKMSISIDYLTVKQKNTDINLIKNPKNGYKSVNLGANINTEHSERTPVISADGQTLFFVSGGDPNNTGGAKKTDIFYSKKQENGTWGKRVNIGAPLNNRGNNSVIAISADNNQLMTMNKYNPDGTPNGGGISQTQKVGSGWKIPEDVIIKDYRKLREIRRLPPFGR